MRQYIFYQPLSKMTLITILTLLVWGVLCFFFVEKRTFRIACNILSVVALYGVLWYTVIGRTPSDQHIFVFAAANSSDFKRELFMNTLLFIPFGLMLSVFLGFWPVLGAFVLSIGIELWQYGTGTGFGQGTDIICNTLGCAVGTMPYYVARVMRTQRNKITEMQDTDKNSTT